MDFEDTRIAELDLRDPSALYLLIVEDLCGEIYHRTFQEVDGERLKSFLEIAESEGLNWEQFNELLLLLDQDRVTRAFFTFFFKPTDGRLRLAELARGVVRFRGFAILRFGNFRFAYKQLSQETESELRKSLRPFCDETEHLKKAFNSRPPVALSIERIDKSLTWCLGYIAKGLYNREAKLLTSLIRMATGDTSLLKQADFYERLGQQIKDTEARALRNTDVYLTWDYMDIYVATSMRKRWEFEETAEFVKSLFATPELIELRLRHFDPTQSQCRSRIDKGLVEGLMLKRSLCTVFMVQESDTMGKDSELASTLAQGKPVIAYVPELDARAHSEKLRRYPLEFFKIRFQVLQAEGTLDEERLRERLAEIDPDFAGTINKFLEAFAIYRSKQPLSLWDEKELEFKQNSPEFAKVCTLLAVAEQFNFNKRATTLKDVHPLSLQVHLESGVANGVLVVRTVAECSQLLYSLLTNSLTFSFKVDPKENCTLLVEKISNSPFRAVTNYEKLSNSFWNFYPSSEHLKH